MPVPSETLLNDLVKWNSQCALGGQYGGSVELLNRSLQYSDDLWGAVKFSIVSSILSRAISDNSCFAGTVDWLYGLIDNYKESETDVDRNISLRIRSFFSSFGKKPVNTYFYNNDADDVIGDILSIFMAVDASLYDLSGITNINNVRGIVSGSNCLEELKKLAQATEADLFVRHDGILVAENWKDLTDSVDEVIPTQAIISAEKGNSTGTGPSVIVVRGRFISEFECGQQLLSGGINPFEPQSLNPPQIQGGKKFCVSQGIDNTKTIENSLGNSVLRGSRADWKNSSLNIIDAATGQLITTQPTKVTGQGVSFDLTGLTPAEVQDLETNGFRVELVGEKQPEEEHTDPNAKQKPLKKNIDRNSRQFSTFSGVLMGEPQKVDFWDAFLKMGGDNDKFSDEQDSLRLYTLLVDTDLFAEFGFISEEIDNVYIDDMETMFDVAVRGFQEFKIKRKQWTLSTTYLPCLRLNQLVSFTSPKGQSVTGRLSSISVDFTPAPLATMKLTVDSLEDTGSTEYTSSNLFLCPYIPGTNTVTWIQTVSGSGFVRPLGGYCGIGVTGLTGSANLAQNFKFEVGADYVLTFTIENFTGGDFEVYVTDGTGDLSSNTYSTDGTKTVNFTAREKATSINFKVTTAQTSWYLSLPILQKVVTR